MLSQSPVPRMRTGSPHPALSRTACQVPAGARVRAWPHDDDRPSPGDVKTMHPYMREELARERERELRRWAGRYGLLRSGRRRPESVRQRAGRALAGIGLALARGSGDA